MRLVLFGTSTFAVPALDRLAPHVVLVVSQPDRPSGRKLQLKASPVKSRALALGIPVATPEKCRDPQFVASIAELEADALLVAAYGQIMPLALLESARCGGINLHGSILPKYRGAAPIQRAILEGETETGVTLMQMDRGMDTGGMIAAVQTPIGADETYGELHDRLAGLAAGLAEDWMPRICLGDYQSTPQDPEVATYAPKIEREDARLRWEEPAEIGYRRFRATTPTPGATAWTRFGPVKIRAARFAESGGEPGTVLALEPLTVAFAAGSMIWLDVQPEGKTRMSGRDWANGARISVGDRILPG